MEAVGARSGRRYCDLQLKFGELNAVIMWLSIRQFLAKTSTSARALTPRELVGWDGKFLVRQSYISLSLCSLRRASQGAISQYCKLDLD